MTVPQHLKGFESLYARSPREAALKWFTEAKFGLFIHYGLYALPEAGEWSMFHRKTHVDEYEKLKDRFTASHFDAGAIADLAVDAGMKYITFTTRHHDSFSLFHTRTNDWHSVASPAGRDLVRELADACNARGLGLFLYYSYGADWWHPYFYPREQCWIARPHYDTPEPRYLFRRDEDFRHYIDFVHTQLTELLTNYGPVAGVWFDPIMGFYGRHDLFPIDQTYALIRKLQPHALISFKQGASGDEDFIAPERAATSLVKKASEISEEAGRVAQRAADLNRGKPKELCNTLQPRAWGYNQADDGHHRNTADVLSMLATARAMDANLLLNTGPRPDGSIDPDDVATLRAVGQHLRTHGFPTTETHGEWTERGRRDPSTAAAAE